MPSLNLAECLVLYLDFLNELKQVKVVAVMNRIGSQFLPLGIVEGKKQFEELLKEAKITDFIVCSGEPFTSNFSVIAHPRKPDEIADTIEKGFKKADELMMKILNGKKLTDEEQAYRVPNSVCVCSSMTEPAEGAAKLQEWFQAKKTMERSTSS